MPRIKSRATLRLASVALIALLMAHSSAAQTPTKHTSADPSDKNVVLTADTVTRDDINDVVIASGNVEFVQGPNMLLAERVIWNRHTDIVTATGDVKLVSDTGDIYFGDYLEITDDMRQGFMDNVSALLADNSRLVGRKANKEGEIMTVHRGIYSPCKLCEADPTQPPTWQIQAQRIVHDSDEKRIYYHDAWFQIEGYPIAWTPYFSTYDPSVKRADGLLYSEIGERGQLGIFSKSSYYFDLAPDMDLTVDAAEYTLQGPLMGIDFRKRFDAGQIQILGSIAESDIRQYPTLLNQDQKTVRGNIDATGEFDLSDHWRLGFDYERTVDNIYILKYGYSSAQVLPQTVFLEGFYDRDYYNLSEFSYQDLRANIGCCQPHALPYFSYSLYGDPGEMLGGRWEDEGSLLSIMRSQGEDVQRIANNLSWSRKLTSDIGLVTDLNASVETDYYWTQHAAADPIATQITAASHAGRAFPQAYAVLSYPVVKQFDYAQLVIEPIVSGVVAPTNANNSKIPNEDSQDIQLDPASMFTGNRFPGIDRMDDGSRVTYGIQTGLYNLGAGYTTVFVGQTYRITGDTIFYPVDSGLQSRFSDYVAQIEVNPGKYFDIDYRLEMSNDFQKDRLQEINFRAGPDDYGIYGTYLFAGEIAVPNFVTTERNEMNIAAYYKFDEHWSTTAGTTTELSHPRAVLRYNLSAAYTDDCSTFSLNVSHDQTLPVGGTSGTAVSIQFTLKNLGIFKTPTIH
jgi:LPS-assembly protein